MPLLKMLRHLDREEISYSVRSHPPAFTAQKLAAAAHIRGRDVAKTVIVKLDGKLAMAVLPADQTLNLEHLRAATGMESAELASEVEFKDRFPDCEAGAMPPFGNLYNLPVYVSATLAASEHIAFNAGNHREVVQVRYADFCRVVGPRIADMTLQRV